MPALLLPLVEAAGVSGGLTLGGATVSYAQILSNVIFSAAMVGAQYALAQQSQPNQALRGSLKQSDAPRYGHFGRVRVSGSRHLYEAQGLYLIEGVVVSCVPVDAVETIIADDEALTLSETSVTTGRKAGFAQIEFLNASNTGAVSSVAQNLFATIWNNNHKCVGLACLYAQWYYGSQRSHPNAYPNGFPRIETILRGVKAYDPRSGSTVWTQSPPILAAWYLTHIANPRLTSDDIDWTSVGTAADDCAASVAAYGGGTEIFASCGGSFLFNEETRAVLGKLMACCDGSWFDTPNGKIGFRIAKYVAPTVTLTDDAVCFVKVSWSTGRMAEFNKVYAKFADPSRNYNLHDAPPASDSDSIAEIGEKATNVTLDYCQRASQAYRCAQRLLRRTLGPRVVELRGDYRLLQLIGEVTVALDLQVSNVSGEFDILDLELPDMQDSFEYRAVLRETFSTIYEDPAPPVDPAPVLPSMTGFTAPSPASLSVTTITVGSQHLLQMSCAALTDDRAGYTLAGQYRQLADDETPLTDWFDYPSNVSDNIVQSGPVAAGRWASQAWLKSPAGVDGSPVSAPTVEV